MTEIELSITRLAALGRSPYQIEEELRIPHYTIHQKYHDALQAGYARAAGLNEPESDASAVVPTEPIERRLNKANEEKEARKREIRAKYRRDYYRKHKAEIRKQQSQYRQANKEKIVEYKRRYQQENKEKIAEYTRRYNERKRKEKQEKEKHHGQEIGCLWAP